MYKLYRCKGATEMSLDQRGRDKPLTPLETSGSVSYDHHIQRALRHKDTMKRRRVTRGGEDPDGAHYTKTGYPRSTGAKDNDYNIGMALRSLGETKINEAREITRRPPSDTVKGATHRVA